MAKQGYRKFDNKTVNLKVFNKGRNLKYHYDFEALADVLESIPFDKVNIPINAYRSELKNDLEATGNIPVGNVDSYNRETGEMTVTIIEKYADTILNNYQDPIIYPKVRVNKDGEVVKILSFDICQASHYAAIY